MNVSEIQTMTLFFLCHVKKYTSYCHFGTCLVHLFAYIISSHKRSTWWAMWFY
jgi:hypothetical protein